MSNTQADRLAERLTEQLAIGGPFIIHLERADVEVLLAALAKQQASPEALCACKDRAASACPGEWEPGCDLGNNPVHVRVHTPPSAPQCERAAGAVPQEPNPPWPKEALFDPLKDEDFFAWAALWFGGDADETYLKRAFRDLSVRAFGMPVVELQEQVEQLTRALREATEGPTFMGEPVLQVRDQVALPAAWANKRVSPLSYVPFRSVEEAESSVNNSRIVATQEGPYELVALYERDIAQGTTPAAGVAADESEPPFNATSWLTNGAELHPLTKNLVVRFARALAAKLAAAEKKYGYTDGWRSPDWMDECRQHLRDHIAKGDPRDVAAYCAFLWHHGASTAAGVGEQATGGPIPFKVKTWPLDADGFEANLCTECGTPTRYGSRHSKCGQKVMAAERAAATKPAQAEPTVNTCKLTECQGEKRCGPCLARDARDAKAEQMSDERIIEIANGLFPRWQEDIQVKFVLMLSRAILAEAGVFAEKPGGFFLGNAF